jgi:hypothetical protein
VAPPAAGLLGSSVTAEGVPSLASAPVTGAVLGAGTLPFTGLGLLAWLLAGAALILTGSAARRAAR